MATRLRAALFLWFSRILRVADAEFLLDHWPNGGLVIVLRACWCAILLFCTALIIVEVTDPLSLPEFSSEALRVAIHKHLTWFGAFFAAAYLALYARFAAQYSYLANLYNQIMQSQASSSGQTNSEVNEIAGGFVGLSHREIINARWMAGYIADASEMHLLSKPMLESVALGMLDMPGVMYAFLDAGGTNRSILEKMNLSKKLRARLDAISCSIDQELTAASSSTALNVTDLNSLSEMR